VCFLIFNLRELYGKKILNSFSVAFVLMRHE